MTVRSLTLRLMAGLSLVAHVIAIAAVCACASTPESKATMAASSTMPAMNCHETGSSTRISGLMACCCDDDTSDVAQSASVFASMTVSPALSSPSLPAAMVSTMRASDVHVADALLRHGFTPPRPPLRV